MHHPFLSPTVSVLWWCGSSKSINRIINKTNGAEHPGSPCQCQECPWKGEIDNKAKAIFLLDSWELVQLNYQAGLCTWYDPNFQSALQEDVPEQGTAAPGFPGIL